MEGTSGNGYIPINQVVAVEESGGIGIGDQLPWQLKTDFEYFLRVATALEDPENRPKVVWIIGRKSFEFHMKPRKMFAAMKKRQVRLITVVLSRTVGGPDHPVPEEYRHVEDLYFCSSFPEVMELLKRPEIMSQAATAWNIGGPGVYEAQLDHLEDFRRAGQKFKVFMNRIHKSYQCDAFYPICKFEQLRDDEAFVELDRLDGVPEIGQVLEDSGVQFSVHVYELQ